MAVLDVRLSWSKTTGSFQTEDGRKFSASVTEGWQVTHEKEDSPGVVLLATDLPQVGDRYGQTYLYCRSQQVTQVSPVYSVVTITYAGELGSDNSGKPNQNNPINNSPIIDWSDEASNEPIDRDWNGKPIVNVNNEPIDGVTVEIADPVLVVTKNFATYNPHLVHAYRMATNSDTFASFPPGTCRLIGASAKLIANPGLLYWQVTGRFKFRYPYGLGVTPSKAWYYRTKNEGYKVRENPGDPVTSATHAKDEDENKVVKPVLIKSDGTIETNPDAAHFLEFQRYGSLPFNALGFL